MRKIALIYMASGFGSRFGSNKLTALFQGEKLYRHGLTCLLQAARDLQTEGIQTELLVVSQYEEILQEGKKMGFYPVYNGRSKEGITVSLKLGAGAAGEDNEAFLFSVADQPCMRPETVAAFVKGFGASGKGMGAMCSKSRRGNPAIFRSFYRDKLLSLEGDRGGSVLMKAYPQDLWLMECRPEELLDVDRPEDLRELEKRVEGADHGRE